MRLTRYTDYALRVLLYAEARQGQLISIAEVARAYSISQNHLMKIVNDLAQHGYIASFRGRSGGIRLGRPAAEINIGAVVRHCEDGFTLVDCANCVIRPACKLTGAIGQAVSAFLAVLDSFTLADVADEPEALLALFPAPEPRG